ESVRNLCAHPGVPRVLRGMSMATDSTNNSATTGTASAESKATETTETTSVIVATGEGGETETSRSDAPMSADSDPTATQLALTAPIPEPAPGENIYVSLTHGEPFSFAFDLAAPGVYADHGPNGEIIIHVPHSDAGQGEQAYGHVIITGISAQEFTAATGEPVQGTVPDSGIPELRDPNDQASFRRVADVDGADTLFVPSLLSAIGRASCM